MIKDFMDSLLENFDGDDDVKEVLGNISDETIDKVRRKGRRVSLIQYESYCIGQAL